MRDASVDLGQWGSAWRHCLAQSVDEVELDNRLAAVLRARRSVVPNNQDLINDPAAGDKNLTGDTFQSMVIEAYLDQNRESSLVEGLSAIERRLT
ncbi:MAG: hypothetical protein ABJQ34_04620 [Paracoccaceae bacterium]